MAATCTANYLNKTKMHMLSLLSTNINQKIFVILDFPLYNSHLHNPLFFAHLLFKNYITYVQKRR